MQVELKAPPPPLSDVVVTMTITQAIIIRNNIRAQFGKDIQMYPQTREFVEKLSADFLGG